MSDSIETEEIPQPQTTPEIPFRERLARLKARRAKLWPGNRHVAAAKKRKNDSFVGGTDAGRKKALAKKAAAKKPKPAQEPAALPALAEPLPLEVAAHAIACELANGLTLPPAPPALIDAAPKRRRGRPPGRRAA